MDFINLMSYDYHGAFRNYTGHNAPLFPRKGEKPVDLMRNVVSLYSAAEVFSFLWGSEAS